MAILHLPTLHPKHTLTASQDTNSPLAGQTALVTGASRGIGKAIALALAAGGAKVACVASRVENAQGAAEACSELTSGAMAFGVNVAETAAVADLVKTISKEMGGPNILVNNAGITRDQILMRMTEDDFDSVVGVNLKGTWNFIKAATRPLMKNSGRIINISSVVAVMGNAGQANYAASKAGVLGMTRSVAKELASRNVCVNAIAPGFIDTDMTAALDDSSREALVGSIPLQRMGNVDDIAQTVAFLAGPAGGYITGQTLVIDGGLSL
ncbi:MAG: 3-oxoacyl-[acyl-carrier-protein] reductase [bacterium]|nr:3-oxoacyl-[acyl-carrier-protein] reductase [bacterium]